MFSCNFARNASANKQKLDDSTSNSFTFSELTKKQKVTLDAQIALQTNTNEMNRLYSTFANIDHICDRIDTSFEDSQSELLVYLKQFIAKHCQNLPLIIKSKPLIFMGYKFQ